MKVVILAGGLGSRLSEETVTHPKPMVQIGDHPIIWHIMKSYSYYGFNDFVILLGYKGYMIKEYFSNYLLHSSNLTIDLETNCIEYHRSHNEKWKITLLETGETTMTGGRIAKAKPYLENDKFMLTYGDGVSNINILELVETHRNHGKTVTMSIVQPDGQYGVVDTNTEGRITSFTEKPKGEGAWINGGFFVCEPNVFDHIADDDNLVWEKGPLEELARKGELYSYRHAGFWKCMDTLRDKNLLNDLWNSNQAKWCNWE